MVLYSKKQIEKLLKQFRSNVVMTMADFISHLKCSSKTVGRYLKKWGAINSYNFNGKFYVLSDIPKYNESGLWHYKGIFFSKYGNLKQTVVTLIEQSRCGLTAYELSELIGLPAHTFISHFNNHPGISRQKDSGLLYVYSSSDAQIQERQFKTRAVDLRRSISMEALPSAETSIIILVELIKHPGASIQQLLYLVRRQQVKVSIDQVRDLLTHHDLLKKTSDFR